MTWVTLVLCCVVAYLIGAIPFSWLFVRWLRGVDLRTVGSGNVGSTNAMRVLGVPWGLTIQALDILKGFLPVFVLARNVAWPGIPLGTLGPPHSAVGIYYSDQVGLAIGVCAVLGHMFPVYLKFRGGKGVNTGIGVFLALAPKAMLVAAVGGVAVLALTRIVSLSSMAGAVFLPFAVWFFYPERIRLIVVAAAIAVLVIAMHRSNIGRLLAGSEPRIGRRIKTGESRERET